MVLLLFMPRAPIWPFVEASKATQRAKFVTTIKHYLVYWPLHKASITMVTPMLSLVLLFIPARKAAYQLTFLTGKTGIIGTLAEGLTTLFALLCSLQTFPT
mmetsp:Transcript_37868/g.53393  ORF Transcript_37868/g.53393 Transcript_37868/m.53393 type:complete len:101 (+) Transcript_37868:32-334(+)